MKNSQNNLNQLMANNPQAAMLNGFSGFNTMNNGLNSIGLQNQSLGQQMLANVNGFNPNTGILNAINNINQMQNFQTLPPQNQNQISPTPLPPSPTGYNFKQKDQSPNTVSNFL
jgi:hypothetical protein